MIFKITKTKVLMWVPNVLKFLIHTRINIIGFDNLVGINQVWIMWMGIDSGGKWSGGNWFGWGLIGWDLIRVEIVRVGNDRVGFDLDGKWLGGIWFG